MNWLDLDAPLSRRHVATIRAPFNAAGGQVVKHVCVLCGWESDWWGIGVENSALGEFREHIVRKHGWGDPLKLRHRETIHYSGRLFASL